MEHGYPQSTIDHCVYYKGSTVFLLYVDDGIFIGADTIDHCVYYKGSTVFLLYVDDGIFIGPDAAEIDKLITSLKRDPLHKTS